jgi:DNA polymerase III subunit gamma/tau
MSEFIVSARKYRPARFRDVVGQNHVTSTLKNAFRTGQLAHAFLFTGPRGVGKTTCARIMAMVLNCEKPTDDYEACDECNACKAFRENASFNIHELDAASNNSVEHIRALIEQVRFQPQQGKYKIYIIDEVHMLTTAAFNAFLKTLEEPPSYAKFILATTEKHKILPTILSRCQIFDFHRIQIGDMQSHLQHICEEEKVVAEPDALHLIAQKADGGLRDALSLYDRIVSFCGNDIKYDAVIENLNILDYDYFFKLTDAMLTENLTEIITTYDSILKKGFDNELFINGLASHFRNVLMARDPITLQLLETGDTLKNRYLAQAQNADLSFLLNALTLCNDCDVRYTAARDKKLHVQMHLIKMCYIGRTVRLAQEKKNDNSVGNALPTAPPPTSNGTPPVQVAAVAPPVAVKTFAETQQMLGLGGSINLKTMQSDIKKEIIEQKKAEQTDFSHLHTTENLRKLWKDFAKGQESPTFRILLQQTENDITLQNGKIKLTVTSTLGKSQIETNPFLLEMLRKELQLPQLIFDITIERIDTVEESAAPALSSAATKRLSDTEKLRTMADENPLVRDFFRKFDLKIEN